MENLIKSFKEASLINKQFGLTENGDTNFATLGNSFQSALLELDQKMVLPMESHKTKLLPEDIILNLDSYFDKCVVKNQDEMELMFRYLFYVRSLRVAGKREKLLFYYLFNRLHQKYPEQCKKLICLIPEFGYFGDLDQLSSMIPTLTNNTYDVYITSLNIDCLTIFDKPLVSVSNMEASALSIKLKPMSPNEIKDYMGNKKLSLAAKWIDNTSVDFTTYLYKLNKSDEKYKSRLNYYLMTFRNIVVSMRQLLKVGEQMMCETNANNRTWADIEHNISPAGFTTKYRKALANEDLKLTVEPDQIETGNRHADNMDRVECRKNLLEVIAEGKIKGAMQDLEKLSGIIHAKTSCGIIRNISSVERSIISAQWNNLVSNIKAEVDSTIIIAIQEAKEQGVQYVDPRNVIPVVDTSGSMGSAKVDHIARGLGILASSLSTLPGCMISFSERPEVFYLDMTMDVFDHFVAIAKGPMGLSTNIDATYRVLLDMMISNSVKETDFALLFLTDGQFDQMVVLDRTDRYGCYEKDMIKKFESTFIGRLEKAFNSKGYNLPRTIFWNLNSRTPGFPASGDSKGIQLVSGYSQSLMKQVFMGDYKWEEQADGMMKIKVDPIEQFVKALMNPGYDIIAKYLHDS